jgi:hypothetical protein
VGLTKNILLYPPLVIRYACPTIHNCPTDKGCANWPVICIFFLKSVVALTSEIFSQAVLIFYTSKLNNADRLLLPTLNGLHALESRKAFSQKEVRKILTGFVLHLI